MTEVKDIFEFTEIDKDLSGIRIIEEGKYKGLHWTFGTVTFAEDQDENGNLPCKFDYIIHDNPNNLEENQDMLNFMGDILMDVIDEELKDNRKKYKEIGLYNYFFDKLKTDKILTKKMFKELSSDYIEERIAEILAPLIKEQMRRTNG